MRTRALAVLERLLEAEARVHGLPLEELELEELGEDDTLLDVVGIAAALEALGVERIVVSPIPMPVARGGSGAGGHGVPAPVVLELLRGFELRPSDAREPHETVTPTGAAVLAALAEPVHAIPRLVLEAVGTGAGRRDPAGAPNVVRVLLGSPVAAGGGSDRELLVLEANVDDLIPELVPDAVEALLSAGARDAWVTPVVMKHGRPGVTVSALCDLEALAEVRRAFFETTSTLGVRVHPVERPELDRRVVEIDLPDAGPRIRVKIGFLDGRPVSAKPEHDDVAGGGAKARPSGSFGPRRGHRDRVPPPRRRGHVTLEPDVEASIAALEPDVVASIAALERRIGGYGERAFVAFSGGVDSSVVLALSARALGASNVVAVTAASPSYPAGELEAAAKVAGDVGVAHRVVRTYEVDREAYARNDAMRCYHCKAELYATLSRVVVSASPGAAVLAGANADDLEDVRPGLWAGERAGVRNPLLDERVGKGRVRAIARALGLRVADKPALACLSSRVELGIRVTPELLERIDRAERAVRALGFAVVRVRHRGGTATIEVEPGDVQRLGSHPGLFGVLREIVALGWHRVEIDPGGYRQGGANARRSGEGSGQVSATDP